VEVQPFLCGSHMKAACCMPRMRGCNGWVPNRKFPSHLVQQHQVKVAAPEWTRFRSQSLGHLLACKTASCVTDRERAQDLL
jgi:hypothetical protein